MECKYLIVGGGVTGLAFANFIKNEDWLIAESAHEVGGYCRSIHQDGFVWDYSGHFFHFNRDWVRNLFLDKMKDVEICTIRKKSSIFYNDRRIDFPFQKNIHQLSKEEFIECLYDLYMRETEDNSLNFLEMLYSKFGNAITEKFLRPYNEKLYACDLNTLDKDCMGRFFPYADIKEIVSNFKDNNSESYNDTFIYPKNGTYEFIKSLLCDLDEDKILIKHRVIEIDYINKIAHFNNGTQIKYQSLISSIPFPTLLKICKIDHDSKIYTSNKVVVFNLGFDSPTSIEDHWVYFPDPDTIFYRVGFYNNIIKSDRMSLYVEVGLETDCEINIEIILKKVLTDLKKHVIIKEQNLISHISLIMNPAYVHVKKESIEDFNSKIKHLNSHGVYSIGRYGGWKYCSIEDNVIEAQELYQRLHL